MSILCLLMSMYLAILAKAWSFLLAFLHSWLTWLSKFSLLLIWIPKSLTLSSILMEQHETSSSKFSLVATIRLLFSTFNIEVIVIKPFKNSFGAFLKFKNERIKVWWTDIRCIVMSIISNINATIFWKEVTDVDIKKKLSHI